MANFTINVANTIRRGSDGNDTFTISANSVFLYGVNGEDTFTGDNISFSYIDGGAAFDFFSFDRYVLGILQGGADDAGDQFVLADSFITYVNGGGGNDWIGAGSAPTGAFDGGAGDDYLTVGGSSQAALLGGAGNDTFQTGGGNANRLLLGGDGNDTFRGRLGGSLAVGGAGDDDWQYDNTLGIGGIVLDGGAGNDVLFAQGAGTTGNVFIGGSGNDSLGSNGTNNKQFGGDGNDSLANTGDAAILSGGAGGDTLLAVMSFSGFSLLDGGDGGDFVGVSGNFNGLLGGAGDDFVGATGNNNTLDGGFGNDQLEAAGAGHTGAIFIFHAGYGADVVTGFARHGGGGTDVVDIQGFGLANFAALQPFMSQSGSDTVINLGADVLRIRNVLPGELLATDFSFGSGNFTISVDPHGAARLARQRHLHHQLGPKLPLRHRRARTPSTAPPSSSMLDGGAGTDNFNMTDSSFNLVLGGADAAGDQMFFSGTVQNNVFSGGGGNDWIGTQGSNASSNVLDGGDGDDFLGSSGGGDTLVGGAGNDILQANGGAALCSAATATTSCRCSKRSSGGSTAATAMTRSWSACQEVVTRTPCM